MNRINHHLSVFLHPSSRPGHRNEVGNGQLVPVLRRWVVAGVAGLLSMLLSMATVMTVMTTAAQADDPMRIMVFGDSLVAGHGLPHSQAFPNVLQDRLRANGHNVTVLNAGVSGDTTAGGRARLDWSLADNPDVMIIVLGGNDLLRGLDPAATKDNLAAMLDRLAAAEIPVLLAGMQAPRNLGAEFAAEFDQAYRNLGGRDGVIFYPFFLDGVALQPDLNQSDGLHPNFAGVTEITNRILPYAERLIRAD